MLKYANKSIIRTVVILRPNWKIRKIILKILIKIFENFKIIDNNENIKYNEK